MTKERFYWIKDKIKTSGKYRSEVKYIKVEGTSDISDLVIEFKGRSDFGSPVNRFEFEEIPKEKYFEYLSKKYM